jgi:hypothetical protein
MEEVVAQSEKSVPEVAQELWTMIRSYAMQETVEPIKGLGRYVALGMAGSVMLGTGLILLAVGGLRALQTETGSPLTGNWSWAPYLITLAGLVLVIILAVMAIARKPKGRT